jgi:hypothetical protein
MAIVINLYIIRRNYFDMFNLDNLSKINYNKFVSVQKKI